MSKPAKSINHDQYEGKFPIPYSRAEVTSSYSSESVGAGDVGNPYHSQDDGSPDPLAMPCPDKRIVSDQVNGKGETTQKVIK